MLDAFVNCIDVVDIKFRRELGRHPADWDLSTTVDPSKSQELPRRDYPCAQHLHHTSPLSFATFARTPRDVKSPRPSSRSGRRKQRSRSHSVHSLGRRQSVIFETTGRNSVRVLSPQRALGVGGRMREFKAPVLRGGGGGGSRPKSRVRDIDMLRVAGVATLDC